MMNLDHFEELVTIPKGLELKGKNLKNCIIMSLGEGGSIKDCHIDSCTIIESDGAIFRFPTYIVSNEKGGKRLASYADSCPDIIKDKLRAQVHALGGVEF